MAGSGRRRHGWFTLATEAQACRLAIPDRGDVLGGGGQAVTGAYCRTHTRIGRLRPGRSRARFRRCRRSRPPVEVLPGLQVGVGGIAGKLLEVFETAPILTPIPRASAPRSRPPTVPWRGLRQELQHGRHGCGNGHPFVHCPELVDAHADEEDDERLVGSGSVAAGKYVCHGS